jgi:hypothetical protein
MLLPESTGIPQVCAAASSSDQGWMKVRSCRGWG